MNDNLLSLGIGIAIGACSLYVIVSAWPLLIAAGAGYLLYTSSKGNDE